MVSVANRTWGCTDACLVDPVGLVSITPDASVVTPEPLHLAVRAWHFRNVICCPKQPSECQDRRRERNENS